MADATTRLNALDRAITAGGLRLEHGDSTDMKTGPLLTEAKKFEKYLDGQDTSVPAAGDSD